MTTNKNNNEQYRNQRKAELLDALRDVLEEIQEGPGYRDEIFPGNIVTSINNLYKQVYFTLRDEIAKPFNPDDIDAEYKNIRDTLADIKDSIHILGERIDAAKIRLDRVNAAVEETGDNSKETAGNPWDVLADLKRQLDNLKNQIDGLECQLDGESKDALNRAIESADPIAWN